MANEKPRKHKCENRAACQESTIFGIFPRFYCQRELARVHVSFSVVSFSDERYKRKHKGIHTEATFRHPNTNTTKDTQAQ